MAFFLLSQEQKTALPTLAQSITRFTAAGLPLCHHQTKQGWSLWLFGPFNQQKTPCIQTEAGALAAATGWFTFDGLTSEAALRRCLEQFDGHTLDLNRCQGHFNLILFKYGQWFLLCDGLNATKIYHNANQTHFSNSFYALLANIRHPQPDHQGCYEYAFNGTTFGEKSFVQQLRSTPSGCMTVIDHHHVSQQPLLPPPLPWQTDAPIPRSRDEAAQHHLKPLKTLFNLYAEVFGNQMRTALSGGYDSRLILALLQDVGVKPELFVYGPLRNDPDVEIARIVAKAAGLPLEVIDKRQAEDLPPDRHAEHIKRNLIAFDGWKLSGLFDGGVDISDRLQRSQNRVILNGSAGEIYRNFYYLPNRPLTLRAIIWSFYSRYRPAELTKAFSPSAYAQAMTLALGRAVNAPTNNKPLPRGWTERSYPLFRGRFWTARDLNINLRFGTALFPFLEAQVVQNSWHTPLSYKQHGELEARMIQRLSPTLAASPSVYGHAFDRPPPFSYRLTMAASLGRPIFLRGYSYRLRHRHPHPFPFYLTPEWLGRVIDLSFPFMRPLFHIEQIHDPDLYNRVATLEYLFQHGGA